MQVQNGTIRFNRTSGDGPQREDAEVVFDTGVTQATVILSGFDVAFSPRDDHHFGQLEVRLTSAIDPLAPRRVNVEAVFGLRDWSGDWDDNYEGEILFTVIGE